MSKNLDRLDEFIQNPSRLSETPSGKGIEIGPSGKHWDDPTMTKEEFISDYKHRYPNTSLSNERLAERYRHGFRLNPETGRLKNPNPIQASDVSSTVLGKNLEKTGIRRPPDAAAHHIVAGNDPLAQEARDILKRYEIDINAPENGVWLPDKLSSTTPGTYHRSLHTNDYYREVNSLLRTAASKEEVIDVLRDIAQRLANNNFP